MREATILFGANDEMKLQSTVDDESPAKSCLTEIFDNHDRGSQRHGFRHFSDVSTTDLSDL